MISRIMFFILLPFFYLSLLSDIAGLLSQSFGTAGLLLVLGLDAWRAKTKRTHWIPGDSLVLGALSLQVLGLFYRPITNMSISNAPPHEEMNYNNQVLDAGGRVVICVFLGILLPDVARSRGRSLWSDMLALTISVTGVLIHLSYEIYIIVIGHYITFEDLPVSNWMLGPNIIIFVSIVLLVLLLGCAALASKSIQEAVSQRIPVLLSRTEYMNRRSVVLYWEAVEEHAVRSWITTRTHQPEYIIARSIHASSIGFLVTVCVAVSIVASTKNRYKTEQDGLDWLRFIAMALQWIFIVSGWAIVCWRWLTAVVYYPRRMGTEGLCLRAYFSVEDFWKTAILDMQKEFMALNEESIKRFSYLKRFLLRLCRKLRLYKLLFILLPLQICLVFMSKICWLVSEMFLSNCYMRRLLMGPGCHVEFSVLYNLHNSEGVTIPENHRDFVKYRDALMHMPGENPAGVWIANKKSIEEMKARLKKGENDSKNCKALISLLEKTTQNLMSSTDPFAVFSKRKLRDSDVVKISSKMMVVSLLTIVMELSAFYEGSSAFFGSYATNTLNGYIQACCQAWKIMELVENSDSEIVRINKQADILFHNLKKSRRWFGVDLPIKNFEARTIDSAKRSLQGLTEKAERTRKTGYDSKNWNAVIAGNSLYKLCENIKNSSDSIDEMLDVIHSLLANVIGTCLFKVGENMEDICKLWAEAFVEEKPWDDFYEVGRAKGVTQQLRQGIKFRRQYKTIKTL